ncbi:MAG: SpoIIE family protein phosphatase [Anaerohalosphaeraceae bacterium]
MKTTMDQDTEKSKRDVAEVWRLLKERALESAGEGVVIADCSQEGMPMIYANRAVTTITGYEYDEVVGRNCDFLQGPGTDPAATQTIREAIAGQRPCMVEILNYHKDRTPFWNRLSITPVRDEQGKTTHFIGIQSDITRRKQAEDSLRQINTQLKHDLEVAAAVQHAQLPKSLPEIEAFKFAWRFKPCQELAGDSLNILQLDQTRVAMYVLDVSGHGVRAALQSFSLGQDMHSGSDGLNHLPPEKLLTRLNTKYPLDIRTGMFFTIIYGVLDTATGEFTYSSAGHPGPVLMQKGQAPRIIQTHSYPIGVSPAAQYPAQTIRLAAGDKLILYTDGVVEALSSRDIPFGEERFLKKLTRNQAEPIDGCLDAVMKSLENWACHINLRDDLSLVGIEAV